MIQTLVRPDDPWAGINSYIATPIVLGFHQSLARVRVLFGGIRSGKSHGSCMEMIYWLLGCHPWLETPEPPIMARMVGPDIKRWVYRIMLPKLRFYLGDDGGPFIKKWWAEKNLLELQNNSSLEFMSFEQDLDKFMGQSIHCCAIDEQCSSAIYEENLNRLIDTRGSMWMSFTPQGLSWAYDSIYLNDIKNPIVVEDLIDEGMSEREALKKAPYMIDKFFMSTYTNPYLDKKSIREVEVLATRGSECNLYGTFIPKSGLIWGDSFDYSKHVVSKLPQGMQVRDLMLCASIDHQTRNEEAILIAGVDRYDRIWILAEIYQKGLVQEHAEALKTALGRRKLAFTLIDHNAESPTGVTGQSARMEYHKHGIGTLLAPKGAGSINASIDTVAEYFRNGQLFILSRCRNLIRQIQGYVWEDWSTRLRDKRDPKERPMRREDHAVAALRYLCHARVKYRSPDLELPQPMERYKPEGHTGR